MAGIPRDKIGKTTLKEIDLAWRAKELELFLWTRTEVELRMNEVSARSLGETKRREAEKYAKDKAAQRQDEEDERVGAGEKGEMHERWLYSIMPEHMKAMYVHLHGLPGVGKQEPVKPLSGVSQNVARNLLTLIEAQKFSRGAWMKNKLHEQLQQDDRLARRRLEAAAAEKG